MVSANDRRTVGAFDVRFFIAIALGLIGVFLLLVAWLADPELDKTGGIHANLWTGLAMVVVAAGFGVWARVRPMYVQEPVTEPARPDGGALAPGADPALTAPADDDRDAPPPAR
jgi:hypothetical protein